MARQPKKVSPENWKEDFDMEHKARQSVAIGTWPTPERTIRVTLPAKVAYDLKALQKVQASILDRFGCPNCHSGLDIRFDVVRSFAVDEKLNIHDVVSGGVIIDG